MWSHGRLELFRVFAVSILTLCTLLYYRYLFLTSQEDDPFHKLSFFRDGGESTTSSTSTVREASHIVDQRETTLAAVKKSAGQYKVPGEEWKTIHTKQSSTNNDGQRKGFLGDSLPSPSTSNKVVAPKREMESWERSESNQNEGSLESVDAVALMKKHHLSLTQKGDIMNKQEENLRKSATSVKSVVIQKDRSASKIQTKDPLPHEPHQSQVVSSKEVLYQPTVTSQNNICSSDVRIKYNAIDSEASTSLEWCRAKHKMYSVKLGRSWGSLPKQMQKAWEKYNCNEIIALGSIQSCDQRWGWKSFDLWRNNSKEVVTPNKPTDSRVKCIENIKTNTYCHNHRVVIDFSKMSHQDKTRKFGTGFYTTYGRRAPRTGNKPELMGKLNVDASRVESPEGVGVDDPSLHYNESRCDIVENRPTFITSNDDIFNLGHYINDVVSVWSMVVLANQDSKKSLLINIDGVRKGGPAGGNPHRLMRANNPDLLGPYIGYYNSWFNEVKKGVDYKGRKVCFEDLYIQPFPGVAWFWNDWGLENGCSMTASSPLYQSFNHHFKHRWLAANGPQSLPEPDTDKVHIVIEVREIDMKKKNNHSSARHIRNLQELIAALSQIAGVRVTAQNFAKLSFEKQVSLSHSAGIFMSMHGAGTTHIFHAALGSPNCCGLIELFPDTSIEFHAAYGYGNLARMHGLHHTRIVAEDDSTTAAGTLVNIPKIVESVREMVVKVRKEPTCLHDVKDTTKGIYDKDFGGDDSKGRGIE